jgi:hypothetical protein
VVKVEHIITGIAISIILPIVYGLFYTIKEKEEKKISYGSEFTVKTSKGLILFFLIWMIICFLGMIGGVVLLLALEEPNENLIFCIIEIVSLVFFLLGGLGFAIGKYNYLVVKEEGIYIKKMFKKDTLVKYSDITYINRIVNSTVEVTQNTMFIITAQNILTVHIVLVAITAVTVILEPLFAKLLKKINTSVNLEETSVAKIELVDEE